MYCKIFPSQQVYDGMTEMNIACDNVFVTDGWICLYKGEKFVASFDMVTINGWVLIDSTADTPQTETDIAKAIVHKMIDDAVIAEDAYPDLRQKMHDAVDEYEPQTDCPWK